MACDFGTDTADGDCGERGVVSEARVQLNITVRAEAGANWLVVFSGAPPCPPSGLVYFSSLW